MAPTTADIKSDINLGPVSVAIEADSFYFQFYGGGVVTDATKCGTTVDHAVDPVGYDTDETYSEYYFVRSSWSEGWGVAG